MHKLIGRLAILTALMLVIAACGGGETGEDAPPDTTAPPATSVTTESTSDGETPSTAEDGDAWEAVEDAAREEGQLVLYTATHDGINAAEIEAFQAAYPEIEVSHTRLVSGELTNRFASETESGAPSADLIKIADNVMLEDQPEWFIELTTENLPNIENLDEQFRAGHYIHMMVGPFVVTSNTEMLDSPPSTWEELIEEPYAGNGMLASPLASGSFMAFYAEVRELYGDEYLEAIRDAGYTFYDSSATAVQQAAAGETAFVGPGQNAHSLELREAGAPLEPTVVTPAIVLTHIGAVSANAQNPNAALVYLNWLLTEEGQAAACQGEYRAAAAESLSDCPLAPTEVIFVDPLKGQDQAPEILSLLGLES